MLPKTFSLLLVVSAVLLSQSITSSLIGIIRDDSGGVVPNATVTAINLATNAHVETKTDAGGNYILLQLTPGKYTVEIAAPGFKTYVSSGLELELQKQARLDATLSVGQLTETVSVKAEAPLLDTSQSTVGDVVNNRA